MEGTDFMIKSFHLKPLRYGKLNYLVEVFAESSRMGSIAGCFETYLVFPLDVAILPRWRKIAWFAVL